MAMEGFYTLTRSQKLKSHYQMQVSIISKTPSILEGAYYPSAEDAGNLF